MPWLNGQSEQQEDETFAHRRAKNDELAAVAVSPHPPQRRQWQPEDERRSRENAGPAGDGVGRHAELLQIDRRKRAEMPEAEGFDEARQSEQSCGALPGGHVRVLRIAVLPLPEGEA